VDEKRKKGESDIRRRKKKSIHESVQSQTKDALQNQKRKNDLSPFVTSEEKRSKIQGGKAKKERRF